MADDSNILKTILFDGQVAGNIVSWEQSGEREVGYWIGVNTEKKCPQNAGLKSPLINGHLVQRDSLRFLLPKVSRGTPSG